MKYLASRSTLKIVGPYRNIDPNMPTTGMMVFDVPDDLTGFDPAGTSVANLTAKKLLATQLVYSFAEYAYEEFVSPAPLVAGPPNSYLYSSNGMKRFTLGPGGYAFFGPYVMLGPSVPNLVARFSGYDEQLVTTGTSSQAFVDTAVDPSMFQFDVCDTAGVVQQTIQYDQVESLSFVPVFPYSFLVKMTNLDVRTLVLSDFMLLWG